MAPIVAKRNDNSPQAAQTLRRRMIRSGNSPCRVRLNCWKRNTGNATAETQSRTIIVVSFHGRCTPYCNARSNEIRHSAHMAVPNRSRCISFSFSGCVLSDVLGVWKVMDANSSRMTAPPIGKLIQKHHRHPGPSTSTPPNRGPRTELMPSTC